MDYRNSREMNGQGASARRSRRTAHHDDQAFSPSAEPRLTDRIDAILTHRATRPQMSFPQEQDGDFYADAHAPGAHVPAAGMDEWTPPSRSRRRLAALASALAACAALGLWAVFPSDGVPAQVKIALSLDSVPDASERLSLLRNEARTIISPENLSRVIERARLDHDPEFSGEADGALALIGDLISGSGATDPGRNARSRLRAAVSTEVDPRGNAILLTVRSSDAAKSGVIAQEIAASYAENPAGHQVRRVDAPPPPQSEPVVASAETDPVTTASVDSGKVKEAVRLRNELDRLRIENADTQKRILEESGKSASGNLASLLNGTFPPELITPTLEDLRSRYTAARMEAQQLAQALGPRHPRLQTAEALAAGLKTDLEREIRGVFADARAGLQQAQDKARILAAKSADAARKLAETGIDAERLEELQAKAQTPATDVDDTLTTASIPALAARPPVPSVERVERIGDPAEGGEATGLMTVLMALIALGLVTVAGFTGLSRLRERRAAAPRQNHNASHADPAAFTGGDGGFYDAPHAMRGQQPAMGDFARIYAAQEEAWRHRDAESLDDDADIARLRREVAALKDRVRDFSAAQYRHHG